MGLITFYLKLVLRDLPILASRLRTGGVISALSRYIQLVWFVVTRKFVLRGREYTFSFKFNSCPFTLTLSHPADIAPLVEIYVNREYEHVLDEVPETIIDLGANYGDSALYLHALYPAARIYAIEPAPLSYAKLKKNVAQFKEITPLQAIVSDISGVQDLFINETGALGNSLVKRGKATAVSVISYTLHDLFAALGLSSADMVKFDVEGAESTIFKNTDLLHIAKAYMGEVHEDLMEIPKSEFLSIFKDFSVTVRPLRNPQRSILLAKRTAI